MVQVLIQVKRSKSTSKTNLETDSLIRKLGPPDLNPCDFFLWGYLKSRVYNPLPNNLDELKANIAREISNIDKDVLKNTFLNFSKRCNLVIEANGHHINDK
jgi:hypothetical protein